MRWYALFMFEILVLMMTMSKCLVCCLVVDGTDVVWVIVGFFVCCWEFGMGFGWVGNFCSEGLMGEL